MPSPTPTLPPPTPTATATPTPVPPTPTPTAIPRARLQPRVPIREMPLTLFNGDTLSLSDLEGQIVVMNFWASWCGPCVTEMPAFERVYTEYRDLGVTFLGIYSQDVELAARAFADRIGVTYPLATDDGGRLALEFGLIEPNGVFPLPTTVLIDANGRVVRKFVGALREDLLRGFIEVLLQAG